MQVVLLAAGLGSRLGALTESLPKARITVGGETLLARAVKFAERLRPSEIIVVGGFGFTGVVSEVARLRPQVGATLRLIHIEIFRVGILSSLLSARPLVHEDFLLMNGYHVY